MAENNLVENITAQTEESEYEEDILIYMDFEEYSKTSIGNSDKIFKLIGLETEKPVLQLGNNIYEGEYIATCGTNVLFEEDEEPKPTIRPVAKNEPNIYYKYSCMTEKTLHMKRIFVREKEPAEQRPEAPPCKIPDSYETALQELVKLVQSENLINEQILSHT